MVKIKLLSLTVILVLARFYDASLFKQLRVIVISDSKNIEK